MAHVVTVHGTLLTVDGPYKSLYGQGLGQEVIRADSSDAGERSGVSPPVG